MVLGGKLMILRRLSANLRAQNWTAILVEFVLVIAGVFLGILAANWNLERSAKQETGRLLSQLDTELAIVVKDANSMDVYYDVSGRYAQVMRVSMKDGEPGMPNASLAAANS